VLVELNCHQGAAKETRTKIKAIIPKVIPI